MQCALCNRDSHIPDFAKLYDMHRMRMCGKCGDDCGGALAITRANGRLASSGKQWGSAPYIDKQLIFLSLKTSITSFSSFADPQQSARGCDTRHHVQSRTLSENAGRVSTAYLNSIPCSWIQCLTCRKRTSAVYWRTQFSNLCLANSRGAI